MRTTQRYSPRFDTILQAPPAKLSGEGRNRTVRPFGPLFRIKRFALGFSLETKGFLWTQARLAVTKEGLQNRSLFRHLLADLLALFLSPGQVVARLVRCVFTLMLHPKRMLLIEKDAFRVCRPLSAAEFSRLCETFGLDVSVKRLENFEQCRVLFPVLRMAVSQGRPAFWDKDSLSDLEQEGRVWDPKQRPFEPWSKFLAADGQELVTTYYSQFQAFGLETLLNELEVRVHLDDEGEQETDEQAIGWFRELRSLRKSMIQKAQKAEASRAKLPLVAQLISNSYFPLTQGDRRTIEVKTGFSLDGWTWEKFMQGWSPKTEVAAIGVSAEEIKSFHELVLLRIRHIDPLAAWYRLVSFVSLDKKRTLKNKALFAQLLYAIEHMLRLFYFELTGAHLTAPDESSPGSNEAFYGAGVTQDDLQYLEFITNQFHLNPNPRMLLVLEGHGESQALPELFRHLYSVPLSRLGIQLMRLGGVGEFEGRSGRDKFGALEKLIDVYHARQTVVFIVLDLEGRAKKVRDRLLGARSTLEPSRMITKSNLIHVWNKSIEFDNFTDAEVAEAMTATVAGALVFSPEDIKNCRESDKTLDKLCREKAGFELEKVKNLRLLFEKFLFNDLKNQLSRPVIKLAQSIYEIVTLNHQPVNAAIKASNQNSGFLAAKF